VRLSINWPVIHAVAWLLCGSTGPTFVIVTAKAASYSLINVTTMQLAPTIRLKAAHSAHKHIWHSTLFLGWRRVGLALGCWAGVGGVRSGKRGTAGRDGPMLNFT
jgi:hypothetical protein